MSPSERFTLAAAVVAVFALLCLCCYWHYRRGCSFTEPMHSENSQQTFLVAYASQTGTAEALARQSAAWLDGNAAYQLLPLNQVNEAMLAKTRQALFVVSTYGEGEAPDNGAAFAKHFLTGTLQQDLSHLQFSVMALGDKLYQQFCGFGHQLYQGLSQLGAIPVAEPLESCASDGHHPQALISKWQVLSGLADLPLEQPQISLPMENQFESWQLNQRVLLNHGSPGSEAYFITLRSLGDSSAWQIGDIAELQFNHAVTRQYSIASVPESGIIELIVRQHQFADGSLGLGSGWLTHSAALNDTIKLRIKPNPAFYAVDADIPAIFIGSGTGLAGLRAHILERLRSPGSQSWLIFGERDPDRDDFLSDEILNWQQQGVIVSKAFSRDKAHPQYVQDVMLTNAAKLRDWIAKGALLYICGNRKGMAHGVDAALQQILGETQYEELVSQQRYRRDIY